MTYYEKFLEEKDKLEQIYPADYPPDVIEWCNDLYDKGHRLISLEKEEYENTNHFSGYSTSGYPELTIMDCVASKDGKTAKKFTEVTLNVLTLRQMTAKIMHAYPPMEIMQRTNNDNSVEAFPCHRAAAML